MKDNIINFEEKKRKLSNTLNTMLNNIEIAKKQRITIKLNQEELFTLLYTLIEYLILAPCVLDSEIYDDVDLEELQTPFDSDIKLQCSLIAKLYNIYRKCSWIEEADVSLSYIELSQALMSFDCLCDYNLEAVEPSDKDEHIQLYLHALLRRLTLKIELEVELLQNEYDAYKNKKNTNKNQLNFEKHSTKAFLESLESISEIEAGYLSEYRKFNFIYNKPISLNGELITHSFFVRNTINQEKSIEWLNNNIVKTIKGATTNTLFELHLNMSSSQFNRSYILNEIENKFSLSKSDIALFLDCDIAGRLGELDAYRDTLTEHINFTLDMFTDVEHRVDTKYISKFLKSIQLEKAQ